MNPLWPLANSDSRPGRCDVVYFSSDGEAVVRSEVAVRVGVKEVEPPHLVCYCFGHTLESIREEIRRTGESRVVDSITARIRLGKCSCETKNPKGSCCLGDVRKAVKDSLGSEAQRRVAGRGSSSSPAGLRLSARRTSPAGEDALVRAAEKAGYQAAVGPGGEA